jgi:hypothetical protein
MLKRVVVLFVILMGIFGTCYAEEGDGWYLFNKYKYNIATDVPRLPFNHLERIYIKDLDINNLEQLSNLKEINDDMSYTIHGEDHGDVVVHVNSNKTSEIVNIESNTLRQFIYLPNVKQIYNINDFQWKLIRQEKIDLGFTFEMVILAKGDPDRTNTSRSNLGTVDIMWYYWGCVVLVNNHVTEINS